LSKLSRLKQEAYLAAKKRDWDSAINAYRRVLELDKNNPTVVNELGDICLKKGDLAQSISHFLTAAAKYRSTGLQNNAVAIYKKILRHDTNNLNAHWYLAEIRAVQELKVEGEIHAHAFLSASEHLSSEVKDIYLKRCAQLFALYPESKEILERLQSIFRLWSLPLEEARVTCLLAGVTFDAGQEDVASNLIAEVVAKKPEIVNYAEYVAYQRRLDPNAMFEHSADVNAINLSTGEGSGPDPRDFVNFTLKVRSNETPADTAGGAEPLGEGKHLEIDVKGETSLHDALKQAAATVAVADPTGDDSEMAIAPQEETDSDSVDLLAEILADTEIDFTSEAAEQVDTIASEIGQQVGGEESFADAHRQYEMGMVYLEMGLFEQACECFGTAVADQEYALRSYEMWGITLCRQERYDEAIAVLERGPQIDTASSRDQLGLIYHTGRAHEHAGRLGDARKWYERATEISPAFQDVQKRLASLP